MSARETLSLHIASAIERLRRLDIERDAQEKYRNLLESSSDAVFVISDDGFEYINQRTVELLGYDSPHEFTDLVPLDVVVPRDRGLVSRMQRGMPDREEPPIRYEISLLRKDGTEVEVENHVSIITFEGKLASLVFTRDITERKLFEREIRESERRYRSLFNDSPLSLWEEDFSDVKKRLDDLKDSGVDDLRNYLEKNPDEVLDIISRVKITAVNKATLDLYRAEDLEELHNGFASLFTEESNSFFREELTALSEGKTLIEGESTTNNLRGERLHVGLRLIVPPGYEDTLEKVILSIVDITERKQLEKERLEHSRELELRVEERTRELLNAERMAAAGSIAAMVGHDLRSPLQSIKNAAYLLKKGTRPKDEALEIIKESVDRATKMLLEFRDQTREDPLKTAKVDIGGLLGNIVKEFGVSDDVNATVEVNPDVKTFSINVLKIRRVMDNLLRNAVEAMPKGGELRVKASRGDEGLVIEVSDTGVDISDMVIKDLFKPFYTTKPGGMGLGLAYCKRAVEAHGGSITVETAVGEGTTFTIKLTDA